MNMKKPFLNLKLLFIVIFISIIHTNVSSQETIVNGLNNSQAILFSGNYLYIVERSANKITKINITETNPQILDVVTGLNGPSKLALYGNHLYISESIGGKISKIDITETNPTIENVLTGLNNPDGLAFKRDYLYFSESTPDKISRINITQQTPSIEVILTRESHPQYPSQNALNNPYDLLIVDNVLYINNFDERTDHYHQITINEDESLQVSSGISFPFYTLNLAYNNIDNSIYFFWPPYDAISRIDLNNPTGVSIGGAIYTIIDEHIVWGNPVNGMAFKDGNLYVSKGSSIIKYNSATLSLNQVSLKKTIKIYPNPSHSFINISGLNNEENYKIFNIQGKELVNGIINNQEKIDIENLANGFYFIKFESGNKFRFIKK
jgi:hypothetical protein